MSTAVFTLVIEVVSDEADMDTIKELFVDTVFFRLSVYHDTIDNIAGVIHHKDFYNRKEELHI